jgi:hypothetical protein
MPLTEYDTGALHNISPLPSVPMGSNPIPIAALLSAEQVSIPYFVEDNLNGQTEIVLTFPMRKHAIFNSGSLTNQADTNQSACAGNLNDGIDDGQAVELSALGVTVQDYPHHEDGSYCTNTGFEYGYDYYGDVFHDVETGVVNYDYESIFTNMQFHDDPADGITPINAPNPYTIYLARTVNVNRVHNATSTAGELFGTAEANINHLHLDTGFESGHLTFSFKTEYEDYTYDKTAFRFLTEPDGGLGSTANNSWRGVPVIGFSAISSELESNTLGETIDLVRQVYRQ